MVVDNKTTNNLANLEASLAPAEAEFGAVAKADQYQMTELSLPKPQPFNIEKAIAME